MSLIARLAATLMAAMAAVLLLGLSVGYVKARGEVEVELGAAREVAVNAVTRLIAALPASRAPEADIASLVSTFNGDRHVRVLMIDAFGGVRAQSVLAEPPFRVPRFLERMLAPQEAATILPMTTNAAPVAVAMVVVMPANEIAEIWSGLALDLGLLLLLAALALVVVLVVVRRALRPLGELTSAFHRIGGGDTKTRVPLDGPPELARLARGCNVMAERLEAMARGNQRLSEQLLRLADEERADLARDLHDDVGPFLFAVDVDAATVARLVAEGGEPGPILERTNAIRDAARHARREVRRILGTLRPGILPGLGLAATLEHLVEGCRARHPEIAFTLAAPDGEHIPDGEYGAGAEALVVRAVREAVNNALRHGHPSAISIRVAETATGLSFRIVDDGGGFARPDGERGGYGLLGMRERVEAVGGRLKIAEIGLPAGVSVSGEIPLGIDRDDAPDAAPATRDGKAQDRAATDRAA